MYLQANFAKAVYRYRLKTRVWANFMAILWAILLRGIGELAFDLAEIHMLTIVRWIRAVGPAGKTLFLILFAIFILLASALVPLLAQVIVVYLARKNSLLHCTHCDLFIGNGESIKVIRAEGKCPGCNCELIPPEEIGANPFEQSRLPSC